MTSLTSDMKDKESYRRCIARTAEQRSNTESRSREKKMMRLIDADALTERYWNDVSEEKKDM